jgi:hypothetical protein
MMFGGMNVGHMTFNWTKFGLIASRPWTAEGWVNIPHFFKKNDPCPSKPDGPTLAWQYGL